MNRVDLEKIRRKVLSDVDRKNAIIKAKQYYANMTEIANSGVRPKDADPMRNADNRIGHNFHEILVDEKVAYMFTYPVLFDIDRNTKLNEQVVEVLGDEFERKTKNLCIEASNCGIAWLHYWTELVKDENKNVFKYEMVNTEEVIPIYDNGLERKLKSIIRYYVCMEEVKGQIEDQVFTYIEYWTDKKMDRWKFAGSSCIGIAIEEEHITHAFGGVPFIEFANNVKKQSDLSRYINQIDLYDRVMSGFANDLEDIQQIIYILENYGGQDLNEFLGDLKRFKAIKVENDGLSGTGGGVKTLQIEIPVEARKVILEVLKKQIYESGQGLQQDVESVGNASGVALKFFYRKLELKSGLLETEFKASFATLIKAILKFLKIEGYKKITQTYIRNMISNDLENAQIAQMSIGVESNRTVVKNHPWTENVDDELKQKADEESQEFEYAKKLGDTHGED